MTDLITSPPGLVHLVLLAAIVCPLSAQASNLETALMPGQVITGHAKWEERCTQCHVRFNKAAQSARCLGCHTVVAQDVEQKMGFHGSLKPTRECRECHTEHKGRTANIAPLNEKTFDHSKSDFPLTGRHALPTVQCQHCHTPGAKYRTTPSECYACHKEDDIHQGSLGTTCEQCHTDRNWNNMEQFDHATTRFSLRGKHAKVECKDCHPKNSFTNTPMNCYACHRKDDYHKGVFGPQCETCHSENTWKASSFNHNQQTDYPLQGKHRRVKCESCHKTPVAEKTMNTTCAACHRTDDIHKGSFGLTCTTCHTEKNWTIILFDHDKDTDYPLRGQHMKQRCKNCHTDNLYESTGSRTCYACHKKNDEHKGAFGRTCEQCHTELDWKLDTFNHDLDTTYPLRGRHRALHCNSCHTDQLYTVKLDTACDACHHADDVHKGQEGTQCQDCHTEFSWNNTTFDHGLARFPLLGQHQTVECKNCHLTPTFQDADSACVACHGGEDVHTRRLGTECETCHNARHWKLWDFDHKTRTGYTLDGAHKKVGCLSCHTAPMGKKVTVSNSCAGCHSSDDIHEGKFGPQCEGCHVTTSFHIIKRGI